MWFDASQQPAAALGQVTSPRSRQACPASRRQHGRIDADLAQRPLVFGLERRSKIRAWSAGQLQPAVVLDLGLELAGRPARVAERQHGPVGTLALGDGAQDVDRRGQRDAVVDRQRRIVDEVIGRMEHEAAPGLDRAALDHRAPRRPGAAAGSASSCAITSSWTRSSEKLTFLAGWLTMMPIAPSCEWAQT